MTHRSGLNKIKGTVNESTSSKVSPEFSGKKNNNNQKKRKQSMFVLLGPSTVSKFSSSLQVVQVQYKIVQGLKECPDGFIHQPRNWGKPGRKLKPIKKKGSVYP